MLTTLTLSNGTAIETTQDLSTILPMLLGESSKTPKAETPKAPTVSEPKARRQSKTTPKAATPKASVAPIDRKQALADLRSLGKSDPMAAAKQAEAFGWSQEAAAWLKRVEPKAESVIVPAPPKAEQVKAAKQQRRQRKVAAVQQDAVAAKTAKQDLAEQEAAPKVQSKRVVKSTPAPKVLVEEDPAEYAAKMRYARTLRVIAEGGDAILTEIGKVEADLADCGDGEADAKVTLTATLIRLYKALDEATKVAS